MIYDYIILYIYMNIYDICIYNIYDDPLYPLVSSNMASWKIPELNGGF